MLKKESLTRWTIDDASNLYHVREWGRDHFRIGKTGELEVCPFGPDSDVRVSLHHIVQEVEKRGWNLPVLLRFGNILDRTLQALNESFRRSIKELGYRGMYRGVYPIKVNQQQHVVEDVMEYGLPYHHGLEAGSKAELIAAIAHCNDPEALVVCNGYKDEEFVDLALYSRRVGLNTILVVEMPGELDLIIKRSRELGIKPVLGVRTKLSVKSQTHWTDSGGDRSTFGLNAPQVIDAVDRLREEGMLDCLQMLHFHAGSQVTRIRSIRVATQEACRFFTDLAREGAKMKYLDVGGGLAVDYDGSQTSFESSCNYSMNEYTADIVDVIKEACDKEGLDHPTIVSESGRATVAHHEVLLFNILDVTRLESHDCPDCLPDDAHHLLHDLLEVNGMITTKNLQEMFHDAVFYRDQVRSLFNLGQVSLRHRALAERIFWHIINRIAGMLHSSKYVPEELKDLEGLMSDIYHCNFSVFQSLPDSWAIDQLFPIMPIHRLNEMPTRQATLSDITCDCDGAINKFIDLHDVKDVLALHEMSEKEKYVLGVFLVGAYQETLGDLHNLLGDTNIVSVRIDKNGDLEFSRDIAGDTVADVLSYVEYDLDDLVNRLTGKISSAVEGGAVPQEDSTRILDAFKAGLEGYTYYES